MKQSRLLNLLGALSNCSAYRNKDYIKVSSEAMQRYRDYLTQQHKAVLEPDSQVFFGGKKLVLV